jgi:hypothetical protein
MGTTHLHRHLESGCKDITKEERNMYMSGKVDDFFNHPILDLIQSCLAILSRYFLSMPRYHFLSLTPDFGNLR